MKRLTIGNALVVAAIALPLSAVSTWADDTHHPAPGTTEQNSAAPPTAAAPQAQPGQGSAMMHCQMMQTGQPTQGGTMSCPMMSNQPGQTQGMGHGMMQGMGRGTTGAPEGKPGEAQPGHEQHHPDAK